MPASQPPFAGALVAMLATQVAATCALSAVPVLAPAMAMSLGTDPSLVGVYSGLVFAAATVASAWSGVLIARFGPVRTNQLALIASGAALLVAIGATVPAVAAAALLVGAGYGPNTPSGSHVLSGVTPRHRRALVFSLKQSGSPLGGMLAGIVLPPVVLLAGWQAGLVVVFVLALLTSAAVEPLRRRMDRETQASREPELTSPLASMGFVLGDPALRRLTAAGVALMVAHACVQTLLVAYLVDRIEVTLALAGILYASMQAAGAVARVLIGWGVDRLKRPRAILASVALLALGATVVLATFAPGWPVWALGLACVLVGVGSSGWYGAFLSEVTRAAPAEQAGFATGGVLFFVYGAHVAAPMAAAGLIALTGSYVPVFTGIAVLSGIAAASFARMTVTSGDIPQ